MNQALDRSTGEITLDHRHPKTLCVILGGGRGTRLFPLTQQRSKPAVPLGGHFRLIDVPISNCLNSGLNQIYVVTQFQSESLHRHVQSAYRFDRFGHGFVEILAAQQTLEGNDWYQGTADAVRQNLLHFDGDHDEMLILSGDQLYRMDFRLLLANHRETQADISIAVLPVGAEAAPSLGILKVNPHGTVVQFHEKPAATELAGLETDPGLFEQFNVSAGDRPYLASMGIYVFNKQLLFRELNENKFVDFGKHLFPAAIGRYRVQAYVFDGYWEDIGTVKSFHEANLELARIPSRFPFQCDEGLIFSRPRMLPGSVANHLTMRHSIVADGCRIQSAELDQSILGIRSIVGSNVKLKRTLVMGADGYESAADRENNRRLGRPNIGIGDNVVVEEAIIDKNARIGSDVVLRPPADGRDHETPIYVLRDGVLCVLKGAVIASGTRIGD